MIDHIEVELPEEFRSGNSVEVSTATIKRERMIEILQDAISEDRIEQNIKDSARADQLATAVMNVVSGRVQPGSAMQVLADALFNKPKIPKVKPTC